MGRHTIRKSLRHFFMIASRSRPSFVKVISIFAASLCVVLSGCKRSDGESQTRASEIPGEKRYPLKGEILAINAEESALKIRHEAIPGFMPAMAMEFSVTKGDLAIAKVGQRIRAELVANDNGDMRLENIWPAQPGDEAIIQGAAEKLNQDTVIRGNGAYREVGESAPDFALYDQDGQVVTKQRFQDKKVMLNFIFTRCQVTKMCPAAVARFQQLQREAREAGVKDLELVSISLDPTYDTPGVLKQYALLRAIDTSNYSFLTGPERAIRSLLSQFGVLAEFRGNILNHTETTVLIDRQGKIVHRVDGSTWDVRDFLEKIKQG
jgi:protein SCO1/2